jgi:hypothetical protein
MLGGQLLRGQRSRAHPLQGTTSLVLHMNELILSFVEEALWRRA